MPCQFRVCAKSGKIMLNPALAADGEMYELEEIQRWFADHNTSLKTGEPLPTNPDGTPNKTILVNRHLQRFIQATLAAHPELWETEEIYVSGNLQRELLQAIHDRNHSEVTRIVGIDKRLLTRPLVDAQHLLALALTSSAEVVQAVLAALGEKFWELPEITADEGASFFKTAATHLGTEGARIITRQLEWQAAEIQRQFIAALAEGNLRVVSVCLDLGANIEAVAVDGTRALHRAIQQRQPDLARLLITRGADRNALNAEGNAPLHIAIANEDEIALAVLLRTESTRAPSTLNLDLLDRRNRSPLHLAIERHQRNLVQMLLEPGANKELTLPPHNDTALLHAVRSNQADLIRLILQHQPNLSAEDQEGNNALHLAFHLGHVDLVPIVIATGINLEQTDREGNTALLRAIKTARVDLALLMLERSSAPAIIGTANRAGETALALAERQITLKDAAEGDAWDKVRCLLLLGADIEELRTVAKPLLIESMQIAASRRELLDALIARNLRLEEAQERNADLTLIHLAAQEGDMATLRRLITVGNNVEIECSNHKTPLDYAVENNHPLLVSVLLEAGASPNHQDSAGRTILHQAIQAEQDDIVSALLYSERCDLTLRTQEGRTALDDATAQSTLFETARDNHWRRVERLILLGADIEELRPIDARFENICRFQESGRQVSDVLLSDDRLALLRELGNRNVRFHTAKESNSALTLLHFAAQEGDMATLQAVLAKGGVTQECSEHKTALDYAVENRRAAAIALLITTSPLNHQDASGQTILHKAVLQENWELVDQLLAAGVDLTLQDGTEKTALHYAKERLPFEGLIREGRLDEIERLIRLGLDINTRDTSEYGRTLLHHAVLQTEPI